MDKRPTSRLMQIREAIWNYLDQTGGSAVSVREAMCFVRKRAPEYDGSDRELSDLVGALATAAGRNVHFDEAEDEPDAAFAVPTESRNP